MQSNFTAHPAIQDVQIDNVWLTLTKFFKFTYLFIIEIWFSSVVEIGCITVKDIRD